MEKRARLLRTYPSFTMRYVRFGLTGAQATVWYNWAVENDMTMLGANYRRVGDGYVKQEQNKILGRIKKRDGKRTEQGKRRA